jgi:hypothetical protein
MKRNVSTPGLVLVALVAAVALWPTGVAVTQSIQQVIVTNWPDLFRIEGTVEVEGPVEFSKLVRTEGLVVAPVSPRETTRMEPIATLVTDGFSHVVLSLTGQTKGEIYRPGTVGAILIPDAEIPRTAFYERGEYLFAMEVTASGVSAESPFFGSDQPRYQVGFSTYRVFLYNTTDKSVDVDLYAYLTN